ncbi:MAG TPA: SAM-dependent methyltransferase [Kineosporiaceae bacterium]|nr:SAM-dependent methyltransferase [Kineosporiaceae bacterium]
MGNGSGPIGPEGQAFAAQLRVQPNIARVYDALLGGKDNFKADRDLAARLMDVQPLIVAGVRANRAFLRRAVAFLARQGISQFLDLGSGLPTARNVHQIAGRVNPRARTVYLDNDPIVLAHARALLADSDRTTVADGDLRDPQAILADPGVRGHLDLTRPAAVIMAAVLHFVTDEEDPAGIVATFRDALAPGSALVVTHVVDDDDGNVDAATRKSVEIYTETTAPFALRTREQVAAWFDGMRLVPPGLVNADTWRRTGNGRTTAPIVAGVGILDPQARRLRPGARLG